MDQIIFEMLIAQREVEEPDLVNGAIKAVQDLYDVVQHDVLSVNMRYFKLIAFIAFWFSHSSVHIRTLHMCLTFRENYETWNMLLKARTEGRLFSKLKWPRDTELVHILYWSLSNFSSQEVCAYILANYSIIHVCRGLKSEDCIHY